MATDNTVLGAAVGVGDTIRDLLDTGGIKWGAGVAAYVTGGSVNAWTIDTVSMARGLPIQPMTGATFPVTDNSGSLTVDAPVGTPVFVRLSDGVAAVSPATAANQTTEIAGLASIDASNTLIAACCSVLDDWDESDRAKVNVIAGVAGVAAGSGVITAGTQRVTLATDDPALVSLAVMDDWDESDRCKVNIIAGQVGIAAGAGAVAATVPRVTLASDDPGVASLSVIDDWDESDRAKVNPIVGVAGVAAGAGAVGTTTQRTTLASDDPAVASLGIIDDWDETDRCKVNPIAGQAGVAAGAGAVAATVQRTTLASDDPAVTALQIMDDWDESDRAKVNIIAGQVGIAAGAGAVGATVPRVTHASDDPVTTSVQLIDDSIVTDDAAFTPATTKVMMAGFEADETSTDSVDEGDGGAARMTLDRKLIVTPQAHTQGGATPYSYVAAAAANQDATAVKASAGQVYSVSGFSVRTTPLYLKLYNLASGATSASTPLHVFQIPSQGTANGSGFTFAVPVGLAFDTGISFRITTGIANNDANAATAADCVINIGYK